MKLDTKKLFKVILAGIEYVYKRLVEIEEQIYEYIRESEFNKAYDFVKKENDKSSS